jgi:hypothetical protein
MIKALQKRIRFDWVCVRAIRLKKRIAKDDTLSITTFGILYIILLSHFILFHLTPLSNCVLYYRLSVGYPQPAHHKLNK